MNINRLIKQKMSIYTSLLIISTFYLFSCQPLPKNIGVSLSPSEIGIVYTAKVKAIYPIFVDSFRNHSYADGVGQTTSLIAEDLFKGSSRVFQYSSILSSFARTGTGIYEDRYAGFYCHYILELSDKALIDDIKANDNVYDEFDDSNSYDGNSYDGNSNFEEDNDYNSGPTPIEIDKNSGFVLTESREDEAEKSVAALFKEQLAALVAINIEKEKKIQQLLQKKKDIPKVFVVNACRDFQIGSLVTVSKSDNIVILQPNFLED